MRESFSICGFLEQTKMTDKPKRVGYLIDAKYDLIVYNVHCAMFSIITTVKA